MDPSDFREVDWTIIDKLREGRNSAPNIADDVRWGNPTLLNTADASPMMA